MSSDRGSSRPTHSRRSILLRLKSSSSSNRVPEGSSRETRHIWAWKAARTSSWRDPSTPTRRRCWGGTIFRDNGRLVFTENSGHYGHRWTDATREKFQDFLKGYGVDFDYRPWG
ncbi:polymorphic toxin type 43 domain-containing protein [Streptomyces sporangiiformans]|uniref:polymorphic toxin type 43 domain-containing protein n=1 Tax=Streptomyces sporangiiformans TaxID=2315329 RepID=UPI001F0896F9|nr:polymorphic toxin type 43 domain-containing protein [Streptomyces sporangiiformans]